MQYAINATGWRSVGDDFVETDLVEGESLVGEIPQWLISQIEAADVMQGSKAQLNYLNLQANAQVTALQGRLDALADAVSLGMATTEEVSEQGERAAQLKEWKTYRVILGRVNSSEGWPENPKWPPTPDIEY